LILELACSPTTLLNGTALEPGSADASARLGQQATEAIIAGWDRRLLADGGEGLGQTVDDHVGGGIQLTDLAVDLERDGLHRGELDAVDAGLGSHGARGTRP
jgi:hypothetical protein